ncbi:hypothetical protein ABPG77_005467 [Micractinium sp. CCAP 211/92]
MAVLSLTTTARAPPTAVRPALCGLRCALPSTAPLTAAAVLYRVHTVHYGFGRLRRVWCAAQQPAAAGDVAGSMPAGSSSPPKQDGDGEQTDGPIDWVELELRFYQAAGCVAAVVILSLLYKPFFIVPFVGPVLWFGYAAFLFGHIFWGGR